jgi:hypothetical protein
MGVTTINNPKAGANATQAARSKSAYVTAPLPIDTNPIRAVLERKGLRTFSPDQLDLPSQSLSQAIREGMHQADLVIAVVDSGVDSNSVFFELGFAEALHKPTLVLLAGDAPADHWLASGTPYLRFNPSNPSGLEFGIDLFLKVPHHGTKPSPTADRSKPIGDLADVLLARLRGPADALSQAEYEAIIAEAIQASGVTSVSRGNSGHEFVDMAVWSDDLSPWVDNPLPIELRMRVGNSTDLSESAKRLLRRIGEAGMKWGLLIYHQPETDMPNVWMMPNILCVPAEEFIEELKDAGFGKLVRGLRNRRVHGAR